jgi:SAM-dependent methyltransferase
VIIAQKDNTIIRHPDSIDYWWRQSLGSDILSSEIQTIQDQLFNSWGDWALQLSTCNQFPALNHGKIKHNLNIIMPQPEGENDLICDPVNLPFRHESFQSLVLHHVLDFHRYPHHVLREAASMVAPYGRLTLCSFNRFSPLALKHALFGFNGKHSIRRLLSQGQIKDWLHLLGFEIEKISYCAFEFPSQRWHKSHSYYARSVGQYLPRVGGSIIVTARKEKKTMTLTGEAWSLLSRQLKPGADVGSARKVVNK